jgi:hypothetical protein
MHPAGTAGPHARRRPRPGAILEAGAAVRTLVARLVMAGAERVPRPPHTRSGAHIEPRTGWGGPHRWAMPSHRDPFAGVQPTARTETPYVPLAGST